MANFLYEELIKPGFILVLKIDILIKGCKTEYVKKQAKKFN